MATTIKPATLPALKLACLLRCEARFALAPGPGSRQKGLDTHSKGSRVLFLSKRFQDAEAAARSGATVASGELVGWL